jgi:hypothetical protein
MSLKNHLISLVGACAWFVALKSHTWALCSSSRSCQEYQWIVLVRAKRFGYYILWDSPLPPNLLCCSARWHGEPSDHTFSDKCRTQWNMSLGEGATRYRFHSCSTKIPRLFAHIHIIRVLRRKHHRTTRLSLPFQHWQDLLWFANVYTRHTYIYNTHRCNYTIPRATLPGVWRCLQTTTPWIIHPSLDTGKRLNRNSQEGTNPCCVVVCAMHYSTRKPKLSITITCLSQTWASTGPPMPDEIQAAEDICLTPTNVISL